MNENRAGGIVDEMLRLRGFNPTSRDEQTREAMRDIFLELGGGKDPNVLEDYCALYSMGFSSVVIARVLQDKIWDR